MKTTAFFFSLILSIPSLLAHAQEQNINGSEKLSQYKPLSGSQWEKDHPGQLPYEQCVIGTILQSDRLPKSKTSFYFFSGTETLTEDHLYSVSKDSSGKDEWIEFAAYVTCTSAKLGLAFQIPVTFQQSVSEHGLAAVAYFIPMWKFYNTAHLYSLQDKPVQQVFGAYKGSNFGWGIYYINGERGSFQNEHSVSIIISRLTALGSPLKWMKSRVGLIPRDKYNIALVKPVYTTGTSGTNELDLHKSSRINLRESDNTFIINNFADFETLRFIEIR